MTRKMHGSWLVVAGSTGLVVGVYLALHIDTIDSVEWVVAAVCASIISILKSRVIAIGIVLISGLIIGLYRGTMELTALAELDAYSNSIVEVRGTVSEDPSLDVDGDMRLLLRDLVVEGKATRGELWAVISEPEAIRRSDEALLRGKLQEGFGTIPVAMYRAEIIEIKKIAYSDVARDVRDEFAQGIRESIDEPEASLGAGFLVGQKTTLPEKLEQELQLLGLTHIVVASGYNLTILVRFARRLTVRISRFTALAFSGGLLYCFALVTGFSPSMSRASLIAGLSLLAWFYGRKFHPVVLLSFSAAVTVIITPSYAWGDIGWLLSFASFVGVIILAPLVHAYFWGQHKPNAIAQIFIETLSAQLLTLPIIAFVFGQYTPLSLLANIMLLPLIPLAMLLTFIAGVSGLLSAAASEIIGFPAEILLRYMTTVVDRLSQWPLASSEIAFSATAVVISYCLLVCLMVFLQRRTGYALRDSNVVV